MTMLRLQRILLATDFSACARRALDQAVFFARAYGASLTLLHVLELLPESGLTREGDEYLERRRVNGRDRLEETVRTVMAPEIAIDRRLEEGIPSERITAAADDIQADLVVVGTHGRTGLDHILLGSTAERVVKRASCPVLTIRCPGGRGRDRESPASLSRLLVPVDFSTCSLAALEYGAQLAMHFRAMLILVHALEPRYYDLDLGLGSSADEPKARLQWEARLAELAGRLRGHALSVQTAIRGGIPGESIMAAAKEQEADLIVMGTHGRRGLPSWISGSVAEAVLRQAPCPVLTVRTPKFPAGMVRLTGESAAA
ncbi:universal stress protein [Candidatus Nitrospira bockiana]